MWSFTEERWHYCGKSNNSHSLHILHPTLLTSAALSYKRLTKKKASFICTVSVLAFMAQRAAETGSRGTPVIVRVRFFLLRALPLNQPQQVTCVQMRGEGAWTDLFSGSPPRSWGVKLNDRGDLNTREAHTLMYGPACWAVCWRSQGGVLNTLLMWPQSSISYWNISSLQHLSIRPHQYWWFFVELSIC